MHLPSWGTYKGLCELYKNFKATTQKMPNAWISHLKAYRAKHPGMSLGQAMKAAKGSYKKSSKADDKKPKKKARKKKQTKK